MAKLWTNEKNWLIFLALLFYLLSTGLFIFMIKKSPLTLASSICSIAITVGSILIGLLYFHEKISNYQLVGIFLTIPVLILLTFPFQVFGK